MSLRIRIKLSIKIFRINKIKKYRIKVKLWIDKSIVKNPLKNFMKFIKCVESGKLMYKPLKNLQIISLI